MSEDNKPNKLEVRTKLLTNRGVGKTYHFLTLSENKTKAGRECLKFVEEYSVDHLTCGSGLTTIGKSSDAYDLSMLVARGLILKQLELYVVEFTDLVDPDSDYIQMIASKNWPSMYIMNFKPDNSIAGSSQYSRLESVLRKFYLNNKKPIFFHIPIEYNHSEKAIEVGDLLSENFFERVLKINRTIEI